MPPIRRSLLLLGLAAALGSAWLAPLDSTASRYAQAGLQRALVSFAMPLIAFGSEAGFKLFLADDYTAGQATIELSASQIGKLSATPEPAVDEGVTGKVKRWWSQHTDIKQGFEELKEVAGRATEYMIKLMVVFVVPTTVLPLLLLWALLKLSGMLAVLPGRKR